MPTRATSIERARRRRRANANGEEEDAATAAGLRISTSANFFTCLNLALDPLLSLATIVNLLPASVQAILPSFSIDPYLFLGSSYSHRCRSRLCHITTWPYFLLPPSHYTSQHSQIYSRSAGFLTHSPLDLSLSLQLSLIDLKL
jgi:hypothetical protein